MASPSRTPHAVCLLADATRACEPVVHRAPLARRMRPVRPAEPASSKYCAPLVLGVRANVRGVAQSLGLLDLLARIERVLDRRRRSRATRAISAPQPGRPRSGGARCARRPRRSSTSANGRSSAAQITSGCMPGAESAPTTVQPASRSARAVCPPPVATSSTVTPVPGPHQATTKLEVVVRLRAPWPRDRAQRVLSRGRSCGQLHRSPRRVEHRRLDVDVRGRGLGE